jgi:hypothetical protein
MIPRSRWSIHAGLNYPKNAKLITLAIYATGTEA